MEPKKSVGLVACLLLMAALSITATNVSPSSADSGGSGGVAVAARARAQMVCTVLDGDHVVVRANVPWKLSCSTGTGSVVTEGQRTDGDGVAAVLPPGTTDFTLTAER